MFQYHLFLAYPVNSEYHAKLAIVAEGIRALFIQNNHQDYLQSLEYQGQSYLGKNLGSVVDFHGLDASISNLISLLQRLIPDVSYHHKDLFLLAVSV